jgi:hypothetical protein
VGEFGNSGGGQGGGVAEKGEDRRIERKKMLGMDAPGPAGFDRATTATLLLLFLSRTQVKVSGMDAPGPAGFDRATLRRILNERFLLSRRVEREGLRRIFIATMLFVGVKFIRHKFIGKREDTSF